MGLLELDKVRLSVIDKIERGNYHNKNFTKNVLKKVEDLMVDVSVGYLLNSGELHPDLDKIKYWKKPLTKPNTKDFEIGERESDFIKEVGKANSEKVGLPKIEVQKFISYWTEKNKSKSKMKWEMQQTFQIGKRLLTWKGNYDKREQKKKVAPFESKFRKTVTNLYVAFCSRCGKKEMPNNKWQLKDGSSCCHVEYLPERSKL
mgnify:FL=1